MAVATTLVQIRERTFLDLLDLALLVVRRRPIVFGLAALAGLAPCVAFDNWIMATAPEFPGFLLFWLVILQVPWATAPLTIVLGGLMFGDRPSARRVAATLAKGFVPMLIYQGLIRGLLLMSFILTPLIPVQLTFLDEVILLERGRWRDVIKRSGVLSGDRGGVLLLRAMSAWFFGFLFVTSFRWGIEVLASILVGASDWQRETAASPLEGFFDFWLFDLRGPLAQAAIAIAVAFFGVVRFLTYLDQRIRLEGWEVELRLKAAGSAMEESLRW